MANVFGPRALVIFRVPRGAAPPQPHEIGEAIRADRSRLGLTAATALDDYRFAGPYAIELEGLALDEYVAWEI